MEEYAIERLIPPWSTNPDFPPGQPFRPPDILGHFHTHDDAETMTTGWEPGTWRVVVRTVTQWAPVAGA
jgi:hypothetical protein